VVPIATEHKHVALLADLGAVTVPCCWLDAVDHSEMGGLLALGRAVGHVGLLKVISLPQLSLAHLGVVGVEALVCILDDECVLHLDRSRTGQPRLLLFSSLLGLKDLGFDLH